MAIKVEEPYFVVCNTCGQDAVKCCAEYSVPDTILPEHFSHLDGTVCKHGEYLICGSCGVKHRSVSLENNRISKIK